MKRMRKFLIFSIFTLLAFILVFAFSACGKKEKITVKSTIKYLAEEDYFSGDIDGKLKNSLTVDVGEKALFVIDYTLSGVDKVSEDTVATVHVLFEEETEEIIGKDYCSITLVETPTSDYSVSDRGYSYDLNVKVYSGDKTEKKFRFIFSVSKSTAGKILPSAALRLSEIDGKGIYEIDGNGYCSGRVEVNANTIIESKLEFQLSPDGSYYTVIGLGAETEAEIEIPDKYKDVPVKAIADNVFNGSTHLRKVKIPNGLTKIGIGAFKGCVNIHEMRIPLSVTEIGNEAFAGCSNMHVRCEALGKPSGWEEDSILDVSYVTWECNVLFEFKLINDGKYYSLVKSEGVAGDVVIPGTYFGLPVTELDMAFSECFELTGVTLPDSITNIGSHAFYNCNKLESITIPDSVKTIQRLAFYSCESLASVIIPDSVTYIGGSAFTDCRNLTSVVIGSGVTQIDVDAFKGCYGLESVRFVDTSTWYYEPNNSITGEQIQIDVTDYKKNASDLTVNYVNCYWEKK